MGAPVHSTSRAGLLRTSKPSGQSQQPPSPGVQTCAPSQPHTMLPYCLFCTPTGATEGHLGSGPARWERTQTMSGLLQSRDTGG